MNTRVATLDDAAACLAIYAPFVANTVITFEEDVPALAEMERRVSDYGASHGWFVAEVDGTVAGYAYGCPHRTRAAYRTSCDVAIYVDPTFARRGIGRELYTALLAELEQRDFHAAFAGIALPNDASVRLHQAFGFKPVGIYREVGWKLGAWHNVGWWQRLL